MPLFRCKGGDFVGKALRLREQLQVVCLEKLLYGAQAAVTGMSAMEIAENIKKAAAGSGLSIYVFNSERGVEIIVRGNNAYEWLNDFLQSLLPASETASRGTATGNC